LFLSLCPCVTTLLVLCTTFSPSFLQGYFGLCCVSEIFYYKSTVQVSEKGANDWQPHSPFTNPNFTKKTQIPESNHKKNQKMMNITWTTHEHEQLISSKPLIPKPNYPIHFFPFGFGLKTTQSSQTRLSNTTSDIFEPKQGGKEASRTEVFQI